MDFASKQGIEYFRWLLLLAQLSKKARISRPSHFASGLLGSFPLLVANYASAWPVILGGPTTQKPNSELDSLSA